MLALLSTFSAHAAPQAPSCANPGAAFSTAQAQLGKAVGRIELERAEYPPATRGLSREAFIQRLDKNDLIPYRSVSSGGANYTVSDVFQVDDGRFAVIAVVEAQGKRATRVYYASRSQGNFRLLPAVNRGVPRVPGFDKAMGEHALGVPDELDELLAADLVAGRVRTNAPANLVDEAVLRNTSVKEWADYGTRPDHVGQQVKTRELLPEPHHPPYDVRGESFRDPRDVRIADAGARPDFANPVKSYKTFTETSGDIDALVYRSRDGKLEYTIYKDGEGKIWFGKIRDVSAPINEHGVSSVAIEADELLTPRWEREHQFPYQFRSNHHSADGKLSDAWNYLRELPEIKEWYRANKIPVPGFVDPAKRKSAKAVQPRVAKAPPAPPAPPAPLFAPAPAAVVPVAARPARPAPLTDPNAKIEKQLGHGKNEVLQVTFQDKKQVFRPVDPNDATTVKVVERTYAASALNQRMGLNTVPKAEFAVIRNRSGVISEIAPQSWVRKAFRENKPNPRSEANARGFEFLVGNQDVHAHNYHVDRKGNLKVFDHDQAFSVKDVDTYDFGSQLPEFYTKEFADGLKALDQDSIHDIVGGILTDDELVALLKRRTLLLDDIARKGVR